MDWLERAMVAERIMAEASKKDLKQFIKNYLKPAGWTIRKKRGRGHQQEALCPCGQHMWTLPSSPGDNRAMMNLRTDLRRLCPQSGL